MGKAFDRIRAGLEDAIAFARGDTTRGRLITPEEIMQRRRDEHKKRADLKIVPRGQK